MNTWITDEVVDSAISWWEPKIRLGEPDIVAILRSLLAERREMEGAISDAHGMLESFRAELLRYATDVPGDVEKLLAVARRDFARELLPQIEYAEHEGDVEDFRIRLRALAEGKDA